MKIYKIQVELIETYEIEAENEEEAFLEASQCAIEGGSWSYKIIEEETIDK